VPTGEVEGFGSNHRFWTKFGERTNSVDHALLALMRHLSQHHHSRWSMRIVRDTA
jgi:hypothetical protein